MSNSKYSIKWKRDSSKPRPEDEMDIDSRREAVDKILEELGIEEQIEQKPIERRLGGSFSQFVVANLDVDTALVSIQTIVMLKQYIENRGDEAVLSEELEQLLRQGLESEEENDKNN